jgi:tetratricopeptide (TPR) repeat protein
MQHIRAGFAAAIFLMLPCATQAQGIQPNPEREPERAIGTQRQTEEAARAAAERGEDLGPPVSYDQLLAAPDDVALNLRYVEQQLRLGNVRGALAPLERVLALQPENARARLLYALVLFRLDNLVEAERELRAVRPLPMSDQLRAEIDRYLAQIEQRQKRTRFAASLSIGGHYDTNRDAQPSSGRTRAVGINSDTSKGEDDFALLGIGTFEVRHDLGLQAKHDLFARTTLLWDEQIQLPQQDLQALFLEAGGTWRSPELTLIPSLTYNRLRLNREHYLQSFGGKLRAEHRIDALAQVFGEAHLQHQDFDPVSNTGRKSGAGVATAPTANLMSGARFDVDTGLVFTLSPEHQLTVSLGFVAKDAKAEFNAYDGGRVQASHIWLLGEGQFLIGGLSVERLRYDDVDPIVDPDIVRRDTTMRARLTYGTPLATLLGDGLPEGLGDVVWTATGELTRAASNLPNYSYWNFRVQMLLSKRWEF